MQELEGRVAVVTGAASGIGLAMTEAFVAQGMKVVMADVEEDALSAQATRLESSGAPVLGVLCDVTDPVAVQALADATIDNFGGVHLLCNNAGIGPSGPMLETTPTEWQWLIGVNVLGVAYGVTTFAPLMVEAGEGHIVNTASQAGLMTTVRLGMYCASKHAVVGLSESLYRELEDTPVGVSCLCPELVLTNIFASERNRPTWVEAGGPEAALSPDPEILEYLATRGIDPSNVADEVVDAVKADRFWVFTHDVTLPQAMRRFEDLQAGRNPSPGELE
ncbi:MAG: SDR family NAD(P)-dependent oxidoreductase [Acidimicrobiia bacterium]|nr:SDR family NAD(P)-dependent oxidoreductase [Actinomycetota bacterium]MBL6925278.1 SDR family NAD(P)-dependent oxidoreductase [Acidimicrobiia bacterium]MBL6926244.1 SDR family NAD(P)-dependent oxidoreductase [Acidimicrobiia bacterium]